MRETSLKAFNEEQERFTTQREKVLLYILNHPGCYDLLISEGLGLTINAVNGRRNFLLAQDMIEEHGTTVSKTGKTVTCWHITPKGISELDL